MSAQDSDDAVPALIDPALRANRLLPSPKVTVGIAFYNPGKYFELAIRSVFAQTFTDWELILLDDGSSDDSLALARSLRDPRVRVYSDGLHKRLNARLNELVSLTRAPYFFRMDADDVMHPERIERQYEELVRRGHDTVIGTNAYSIDAESNIVGLRYRRPATDSPLVASFIHPTVAAATAWFRRNPYSESFVYHRSQDIELWGRTACVSTFVNLSEPLLYYREAGVLIRKLYWLPTWAALPVADEPGASARPIPPRSAQASRQAVCRLLIRKAGLLESTCRSPL